MDIEIPTEEEIKIETSSEHIDPLQLQDLGMIILYSHQRSI